MGNFCFLNGKTSFSQWENIIFSIGKHFAANHRNKVINSNGLKKNGKILAIRKEICNFAPLK